MRPSVAEISSPRGTCWPSGPASGHEADVDGDGEDEEQHRQHARDQRGGEHGDDVGLDDDRVDDQHHRRRDQDAERAAGGDRAGGERRGVAVAAQFRQRHPPHGRGGGGRGARQRAEAAAGGDRGHRHAAAEPAEQRVGPAEQVARQAAARREATHQDEHRQHRQVVVGELGVGEVLELVEDDGQAGLEDGAADAGQDHRVGDRNTDRDQREQHDEPAEAEREAFAHGSIAMARWGTSQAGRPRSTRQLSTRVAALAASSRASDRRIGGKAVQSGSFSTGVTSTNCR